MRVFIFSIFFLLLSYQGYAQSDYLIVRLKSGVSDSIKISEISSIKFESIISVEETYETLNETRNFPNPFNESTTIEFELDKTGYVEIMFYDNSGNLIRKLTGVECLRSKNKIKWDTKDNRGEIVPSGIYYYEIRFSNTLLQKQIIKVK